MNSVSLGNLARLLSLREDTARVRGDVQTLSQELSTGRRSRPEGSASGGFAALPALEASIQRTDGYQIVVQETRTSFDILQQALAGVQGVLRDLTPPALLAENTTQPALVDSAAADARSGFDTLVSRLNTEAGGATLLAGVSTDGPALASGDAIISDVVAAITVAGATTAADVEAVVDTWFAPGGGFDTTGYLGAALARSPVAITDNDTVDFSLRADNAAFRETLGSAALAAVLDSAVLNGLPEERAALMRRSGERMLNAEAGVIAVAASVGTQQERIEAAEARLSAEKLSYELARSEIVDADPFETATRLRAAEAQLDTIFTVTARLSRLSLTEYLR